MKQYISEIVKQAARADDINEKVMILRQHKHPSLVTLLRMAIDPNLKWSLPPGAPPFTSPEKPVDLEHVLYNELRRVYLFLEGGNPNLKQQRREELFVFFLESLHPNDAEFFINVVKDRKLPVGLTPQIIKLAYPEIQ